jgi:hypothetical protein
MQTDKVTQLLRDADARHTIPPLSGDLAQRVRRRLGRRRARRAGVAVALLATAITIPFWPSRPSHPHQVATTVVNVARLKSDFARLQADAQLQDQIAKEMLASARSQATPVRPVPDVAQAMESQIERSSLILLRAGERLSSENDGSAQASDIYQRIVKLFPGTRGAEAARRRLRGSGSNCTQSD